MTRLTNEMRESILHSIMKGLPVINYAAKIHEVVQSIVIKHAPKEVQALYADKTLKKYLNTTRLEVKRGNKYVQLYQYHAGYGHEYYNIVYGLTKELTVQMDENMENLLVEGSLYHEVYHALKEKDYVNAYFEQSDLRESVQKRLNSNLASVTTVKRLYDVLEPELHGYIPVVVDGKSSLPACVAPVVDDLRRLGATLPETPKAA
jgi:hypothetical protein